jgi:hypothetical protein
MENVEKTQSKLYWRNWALLEMKKFIKIYAETKNENIWECIQNLGIFARKNKEEGVDKILSEKD